MNRHSDRKEGTQAAEEYQKKGKRRNASTAFLKRTRIRKEKEAKEGEAKSNNDSSKEESKISDRGNYNEQHQVKWSLRGVHTLSRTST